MKDHDRDRLLRSRPGRASVILATAIVFAFSWRLPDPQRLFLGLLCCDILAALNAIDLIAGRVPPSWIRAWRCRLDVMFHACAGAAFAAIAAVSIAGGAVVFALPLVMIAIVECIQVAAAAKFLSIHDRAAIDALRREDIFERIDGGGPDSVEAMLHLEDECDELGIEIRWPRFTIEEPTP